MRLQLCSHTNHCRCSALLSCFICVSQHCLCKNPVYYSCLSSHHVYCLLPVSWMDWQQFRVATWNPALTSTLKQIPLSLTQSTTLMCARRKAHAHIYSNRIRPHTKYSHINAHMHAYTYTHTHTQQFWEMPVRSPFEFMCFGLCLLRCRDHST